MTRVSSSIPNLINGVSQQPATIRLKTQAELQENALSSVVEGLMKRPPTQHVAKISDESLGDLAIHHIDRDEQEKYIVVVGNNEIKVFDLLGNRKTVNLTNPQYLTTDNPKRDIRLVTIADYTFITNRSVKVEKSGTVTPEQPNHAIFNIKQSGYGIKYSITVDGKTSTWTSPDGSNANQSPQIATTNIALKLYEGLVLDSNYQKELMGSAIYVKKLNDEVMSISSSDGFGDEGISAFKAKVADYKDLPVKCKNGYVVQVTGTEDSDFDNYYVEFEAEEEYDTTGVWAECAKPGMDNGFKPETMPHVMVREADGTFSFKPAEWDERGVGDEDSNPDPSFVDSTINDVIYYNNRLAVLTGENIVFTRAGLFFNFWAGTVTAILDEDPLDVAVSSNRVSILYHALNFNGQLMLFSDKAQFSIDGTQGLTPLTVAANLTTEYDTLPLCKPVSSGQNVFFAYKAGRWSGVREYYIDNYGDQRAQSITSHIPKYLDGSIERIEASKNEDTLLVISDTNKHILYVYKYFMNGTDKLQSSWSKFILGKPGEVSVLSTLFIASDVYLVVERHGKVYIEYMDMELAVDDAQMGYPILLDRKAMVQGAYNVDSRTTEWTLPYTIEEADIVTVQGDGLKYPGKPISTFKTAPNKIAAKGDYSSGDVYVGVPYEMRYVFSEQVIAQPGGDGTTAVVTDGRIQILDMRLNYADTGYFEINVTPFRRPTKRYKYTGKIVGSAQNLIGAPTLETDVFRFPIMASTKDLQIEIASKAHLPVKIQSAEWTGRFVLTTQRV